MPARRAAVPRRRTENDSLLEPSVARVSAWKSTLLALVGLVGFFGVVLGEMALGGAVLHAFLPARHFDVFSALHRGPVTTAVAAVSVIWLLPPHPWAKKVVRRANPAQATTDHNPQSDGAHGDLSPSLASPWRVPMP